jgi:hypothetical protein
MKHAAGTADDEDADRLLAEILYYFNQFGQKLTFLHFRKISENLKNREKFKSGVKKKNGVTRDGRIDRNGTVYCTNSINSAVTGHRALCIDEKSQASPQKHQKIFKISGFWVIFAYK